MEVRPVDRAMCRKLTAKVVWVISSFIVYIAMAKVTILSSCRSR